MNQNKAMKMDSLDIAKKLPHKYPFIFIDRINHVNIQNELIESSKMISSDEPFIKVHFPENPVYPGIFLIEGFAQTALILQFLIYEKKEVIDNTFLSQIHYIKFRHLVKSGDQVIFKLKKIAGNINSGKFTGEAFVKSLKVAETTFSCVSKLI